MPLSTRRQPATNTNRLPLRRAIGASVLLLLAVVGPIVQEMTAATGPRYTTSAALLERRTIVLDEYAGNVFVDRLEIDGHLYSDKAPGQPFLAVPVYAAARLVGAESATVKRIDGNLGVWWVTLWSSLVAACVLLALMVWAARELGDRVALLGGLGLTFGSLLLPFSAELYGHLLAALLAFASWRTLRSADEGFGRTALAGVLCGAMVATEYSAGVALVVLVGFLVWTAPRRLPAFIAGGLPFAAFLAVYQWWLTGSPFTSSYAAKEGGDESSPFITGVPSPARALEVLFGSRGLFLFTPFVAVAVVGLVIGTRRRAIDRVDGVVAGAMALGFFALQAGWANPWGGLEMPGPRYLIPGLPFLVPGAAYAWRVWPRVCRIALVISVVSMTFPLVTRHLTAEGTFLIESQLHSLDDQGLMPTIFTLAIGPAGWIVHVGLVIAAAWWLRQRYRELDPEPMRDHDAPAVT